MEILSKNPYRFYIYPNVWTFRGPKRLEILSQFLAEAEAVEDFELCARILEVQKALTSQLQRHERAGINTTPVKNNQSRS